jgi:hypothetical protein
VISVIFRHIGFSGTGGGMLVLQRLARVVNVSDCTANEYFNFFSLDDTQALDIVSDSLRIRNINTHLYSF